MSIIPWVTQQYQHRAKSVASRRSLNIYPETTEGNGKTDVVWIGTPGTRMYCDLSAYSGSIRGIHSAGDNLYVAVGGSIVKVVHNSLDGLGYASTIGSIGAGSTFISMVDDGAFVVGTDGSNMFKVQIATDAFSIFTGPTPTPTRLVYVGSRAVAINDTEQFEWSELQDAANFQGNFALAATYSDPIIGVAAKGGELWLFGPKSYEVWRVDSDPDLPFALVGGSAGDIGCGSAGSVAQIADSVYWLGSSTAGANQVFMSNGYQAQRISTHAIEYALSQIDTSDGQSFCYQQEGHVFYVLTFAAASRTFVYDSSTSAWHERSKFTLPIAQHEAWEPYLCSFFGNKVVVGSSSRPILMSLDLDKYEEQDGSPIVRVMQGPALWNELNNVFHLEFQLDLEAGVGLQNGQGTAPVAMMSYSDDGGHTWSNERTCTMGRVGEYSARLRWRRLGRCRDRVYRVSVSDPVKTFIIGGKILAEAVDR